MKIGEYSNKELYEELLTMRPEYYDFSIGTPEQTRVYYSDLFRRINLLLAKHNIIFNAEMYHQCRGKDKIELWKTNWKRGAKNKLFKSDDWIVIYKDKGGRVHGSNVDPDGPTQIKQEDYNPWE